MLASELIKSLQLAINLRDDLPVVVSDTHCNVWEFQDRDIDIPDKFARWIVINSP